MLNDNAQGHPSKPRSVDSGRSYAHIPRRLTRIDESKYLEGHFLTQADRCLYYRHFNVGKGASIDPIKQLVTRFKRKPTEIAHNPHPIQLQLDKEAAITEIAAALRRTFDPACVNRCYTFVPMPGSKHSEDPDHCDRLKRTLQRAFAGYAHADVRPMLLQTTSTAADHDSGAARLPIDELRRITRVDLRQLAAPVRKTVIVFDDVITFGKHFRVASDKIRELIPHQDIVGVFIARAIHPRA